MMINFYIMPHKDISSALKTICMIIEKAFNKKNKVLVYTPSEQITNELDNKLWTFKEDSFLAHSTINQQMAFTPIYINNTIPELTKFTVVLNLTEQYINLDQNNQKLIEFVFQEPSHKHMSREKFKYYKNQKYTLNTYNI